VRLVSGSRSLEERPATVYEQGASICEAWALLAIDARSEKPDVILMDSHILGEEEAETSRRND
jgi:hypothetical protein